MQETAVFFPFPTTSVSSPTVSQDSFLKTTTMIVVAFAVALTTMVAKF